MDPKQELTVGFKNDVMLAARADTFPKAVEIIRDICTNGALKRSATHHSEFEHNKVALLRVTRKQQPNPTVMDQC